MSLEDLYKRRTFGIKPGLDTVKDMLSRIGNPEREMGIIHVAGTNGKGSVCAMLESILLSSGYKTGLYTSPHLVRFNERIRVNGSPVSDHDLDDLVSRVENIARESAAAMGREPTFFECATVMAVEYFFRKGVKLAVLETGMGGRLDATNVVVPLISVITRIDVEHSEHLGPDIESIAREKCGIIKKARPVVCGEMEDTAIDIVRKVAGDNGAMLIKVADNAVVSVKSVDIKGQKISVETQSASYGTITMPLPGRHQVENLATAVSVIDVLNDVIGLEIKREAVIEGIAGVNWPGRCQLIRDEPPVLLDGAHNPSAASALAETLKSVADGKPLGLVLGMCADKDVKNFLHPFSGLVKRIWVTGIKSERNMPVERVLSEAGTLGIQASEAPLSAAMKESIDWAIEQGGVICVTGSLFLVGEVLESYETD